MIYVTSSTPALPLDHPAARSTEGSGSTPLARCIWFRNLPIEQGALDTSLRKPKKKEVVDCLTTGEEVD